MKHIQNLKNSASAINQNPQTLAISSSGLPRGLDTFEEKTIYHSAFPDVTEVSMTLFDGSILHKPIETYLKNNSWHLHRRNFVYNLDEKSERLAKELWIHEDGYMIVSVGDSYSASNPRISDYLAALEGSSASQRKKGRVTFMDGVEVYYPTEFIESPKHQKFFQELLQTFGANCIAQSKKSSIYIISQEGRDYYAKSFSMKGHIPEVVHMDEHYGKGFTEFYSSLLGRIKEENKGLVLFHGDPGTGKTQFIRMLLEELAKHNKSILYAPPSLSAQLTEPHMIEFISEWVMEEENDCILLIEDAEPLLETRNGMDGRSTGISNLLNITDGILNDMLGLMVIATFNTDIGKIDSALLRPQRLIARKEFSLLGFEQGELLASALGIKNPLDETQYPASLADFYSAQKQTQILVHEVKEKRQIGFK